jgi:hypothetical protein
MVPVMESKGAWNYLFQLTIKLVRSPEKHRLTYKQGTKTTNLQVLLDKVRGSGYRVRGSRSSTRTRYWTSGTDVWQQPEKKALCASKEAFTRRLLRLQAPLTVDQKEKTK